MRKLNLALLVALAIVLGSSMALADDLTLGGNYNSGITITGGSAPGTYGGGSIGPSTLNGVSLPWVYCVDLPDEIGVPGDYPNTTVTTDGMIAGSSANYADGGITGPAIPPTAAGTLETVTNDVAVAWLLFNFANGATTADAQEALQAAIWTTIYGGGYGSGDSTSQTDYNNDIAALDSAEGSAGGLTNYVSYFDWLSPNGDSSTVYQGLVTRVPDGGMTIMMLGGVLAGLETLRRRFGA